ncbi:MAG: helix-turn-helix transcriptional regulator [Clostridia bacterium]|nr:helix-turn-helix transcriptional regulator [Clostridia bacterium]
MTREKLVEILSNEYLVDIDKKSIQRYENGEFLPKIDNLIALAEFFDSTLDYIVYGKETSDDNSFTYYDAFKRLNRLIFSLSIDLVKDNDGKIYIQLCDEEAKVYWERINTYGAGKNYSFDVRNGDPTINVKDMDELFSDFTKYKEQLLPNMDRFVKLLKTRGINPEIFHDQRIEEIKRKRKV